MCVALLDNCCDITLIHSCTLTYLFQSIIISFNTIYAELLAAPLNKKISGCTRRTSFNLTQHE
jgi:hypothetical protein